MAPLQLKLGTNKTHSSAKIWNKVTKHDIGIAKYYADIKRI
uniref:Uncharacterized protein n=1 Tax=uncultured Desulfobacterium sp. TaxID=201089 RepID=E1YLJ4_9BACT|nr:unknown protein [uncultured Desulfobacterium sp.]